MTICAISLFTSGFQWCWEFLSCRAPRTTPYRKVMGDFVEKKLRMMLWYETIVTRENEGRSWREWYLSACFFLTRERVLRRHQELQSTTWRPSPSILIYQKTWILPSSFQIVFTVERNSGILNIEKYKRKWILLHLLNLYKKAYEETCLYTIKHLDKIHNQMCQKTSRCASFLTRDQNLQVSIQL